MNRILRRVFVCTFVFCLSISYVNNALWACDEENGHSTYESGKNVVQTKAEVKGGKDETVKDPVCGMDVSDIGKAPSEEYKGKIYYFCSEHCRKTFKKDSASYIPSESPQPGKDEGHKH